MLICDFILVYDARIYAIDRNDDILLAADISCTHLDGVYCPNGSNYKYKIKENGIFSETIGIENLSKAGLSGVGKVWLGQIVQSSSRGNEADGSYQYIFRLPSSCKITSGTGMSNNPFKISC